ASEWTTGEAWAPDGFMEDAHAHPEPDPEPEPDPDPDPDPEPDPEPDEAPAAPRNVRAHCITHQSSKVEWDRDPAVHEYEVWLAGAEDAAQRTQDTIVTVTGLKPLTSYTAIVVAYSRSGKASAPGTVQFRTGSAEPAPEPDPDVDTAADWPAPELQVWPLENGKVRASWVDPDDGQKPKGQMGYPYWHVSLDQKTWFFTRSREYEFEVAPGGEVFVSVYGVWDNNLTAIATRGVALCPASSMLRWWRSRPPSSCPVRWGATGMCAPRVPAWGPRTTTRAWARRCPSRSPSRSRRGSRPTSTRTRARCSTRRRTASSCPPESSRTGTSTARCRRAGSRGPPCRSPPAARCA